MSQSNERPGCQTEAPKSTELGHILAQLPRGRKLALILRVLADLAEEDVEAAPVANSDVPMTIAQLQASGRHVTAGWARTHVAEAGRGPRRTPLYYLSDVDAALVSAAQPPRPPRKAKPLAADSDPLDALLASGELRRTR